jgi:hypothetical protein
VAVIERWSWRPNYAAPPVPAVFGYQFECRRLGANLRSASTCPCFRCDKQLASWAGQCSGNDQSAGKRRSGKTRNGSKWLDWGLEQSAMAAIRTNDSYLAAQYARLRPRRGHKKALGAVKHSILIACWHMLSTWRALQRSRRRLLPQTRPERITKRLVAHAVNSIRSWWQYLGKERYPHATSLTITADCGGSNGNRTRLWKVELQKLADQTGLDIAVCHFPPGTSKWNKIEHRLFSYITMSWRGKPLVSLETIINLTGATTTRTGLEVYARLDPGSYPDKIRVSDAELTAVDLHPAGFHPEWNYTIKPRAK